MEIKSAYKLVRPSIVAFVSRWLPDAKMPFPSIIGTGFVVDTSGLIATNAHVVRAFDQVPKPQGTAPDEWPVFALLLNPTEMGVVQIPLEIKGVFAITGFDGGKAYYGPKEGPDLALVRIGARGLSAVSIDATTVVEEGTEVGTAGFPMGTDALFAPGWLNQVSPTLQRGIVSAVQPFPCPTPHAYAVGIMTQGGASGSPVFSAETGRVLGVLYAGLHDFGLMPKSNERYRVPTNISYVVPSHYLARLIEHAASEPALRPDSTTPTLDEMFAQAEFVNAFDGQRMTRKTSPAPE